MPCVMRWPGVIQPGSEINHITSHEDWVPTLVAAAGEPNMKEKLLTGYQAAGKTFKVHLDGYDQLPYVTGRHRAGQAHGVLLLDRRRQSRRPALRPLEARLPGATRRGYSAVWENPLIPLRFPKLFDLRADPFERADVTSNTYYDFFMSDGSGLVHRVSIHRGPFLGHLQGVSAESAAVELQHRSAG